MKIKNILVTMLFLITVFLPMFVGVGRVEAVSVNATFEMPIDCQDCSQRGGIYLPSYRGTMTGILNKYFNFKKPSETIDFNTNVFLNSNLNIGEKIIGVEGPTIGSWVQTGAHTDTPPMDGVMYVGRNYISSDSGYIYSTVFNMGVSTPLDKGSVQIVSENSNIVSCVGFECTAVGTGTVRLTVNFLNNNNQTSPYGFYGNSSGFGLVNAVARFDQYVRSPYSSSELWNVIANPYYATSSYETFSLMDSNLKAQGYTFSRYREGRKSFAYSFPSMNFTITVPEVANTPQVSACTGATAITKNSATVNWSYTDVDPLDVQTQYQVQLSTKSYNDPTFSTSTDVVFSSSSASANTNHTFTGLTASTTYYSRVQTYNATNGWSGFSSCAFGFTTSPDSVPPGSPVCLCNGTRTLTCTTNGIATTTDPGSSSCAFSSYCSVATTTTTTTFTFGPASNRIGNVKYDHSPGITATKNGPDYTYNYPIPKVDGVQSLTVILTDLADNSTTLPRTCSVTNTTPSVTTTPTIGILKSPRISLNKNSKCKLDWDIQNMPTDTTCTLSGFSTGASTLLPLSFDPNITTSPTSWTSGLLQQNTKYTIKCTSGTPATTISASTICRINPSIGEI